MQSKNGFTLVELLIVVVIISILTLFIAVPTACGVGGCGPSNTVTATVMSKHIDSGGKNEGSSYMVTTDKGVFEVDNGPLLGVWNSDELYGRIQIGHTYTFHTEGQKYTNPFMQYYPFIIRFQEVSKRTPINKPF